MEDKISVSADIIEFKEKMPSESQYNAGTREDEPIRIYIPPTGTRNKRALMLWRFALTTVLFFLLFMCCAVCFKKEQQKAQTENPDDGITVASIPESTSAPPETDTLSLRQPLVIDESKLGVIININDDYSLEPLIGSSGGVKILIVHSHNSEFVSESTSVIDAGIAIAQILTSAGIGTYHCISEHDSPGSIGAYSRMKETVSQLIEKYPDAVCVIDIHDSDSGLPLTFTVGTDGNGWTENLRLAEAVCGGLANTETAFRFLPGTIGQDSGVLTLNIGIGGKDCADSDAREVIASVASAIIEICIEKASASQ